MATSGSSGKSGKYQGKKNVLHTWTYLNRIHVRCCMYHVMQLVIHGQRRNVIYATYILHIWHTCKTYVKYILFSRDTYLSLVCSCGKVDFFQIFILLGITKNSNWISLLAESVYPHSTEYCRKMSGIFPIFHCNWNIVATFFQILQNFLKYFWKQINI